MSERDAAAVRIDVVPPVLEPGIARELQDNRRESLVHLDHRDVVPGQAGAGERLRTRLRIAVQHPVRIHAGEPERHEPRARLETQPRHGGVARDQHRGRSVANLRRVAGRDLAVGQECRRQGGKRLRRGVATRRLVDGELHTHVRVRQVDRDDLVVKAARVDRIDRAAVRLERDGIELLPRESPLVRDHLGRDPLRHDLPAVEERVRQVAAVRPHRDARHHLDPGRDDEVELPRPHRRGGVHVRLHRRSALAVDGRTAHGLGPPGDEGNHPAEVPALLTDLRDTAELDVLDLPRLELVSRAMSTYTFAAVEARKLAGEMVPMDAAQAGEGKLAFTLRRPIGVVGAISPFNFPLNLVAHKLAPALAAGCAVVLKPASQTPLSALLLAELEEEAGLPPGWLSVVVGSASEIGDVLVEDDRVAALTFTGSGNVGWGLAERAPRKHVALELGNSTPVIVAPVASLDEAIELANGTRYGLQAGIFTNDVRAALHAAQELEFGGVTVNEAPTFRADQMPYGGVKDSGNTREGPAYAVRELTEEHLVVINS